MLKYVLQVEKSRNLKMKICEEMVNKHLTESTLASGEACCPAKVTAMTLLLQQSQAQVPLLSA